MKVDVLVAEIGSTTTVVNAFRGLDSDSPEFFAQGESHTSVIEGDVRIGLSEAIEALKRRAGIDSLEYDQMLATSSAAGGLKMTVHGLVYDMTAKAAKEAALGAGGIIHYVTAGRLRRSDLARIKEVKPNLILLAGGVDFGERDTAIYNAEMLRSMGLKVPVIYAGNIENQEEMKLIFDEDSGMPLYNIENVYPRIDELNVEPCRRVIQEAFEEHITKAPGMEHVHDMVNGPIIPTPGAVMECTKLIYDCIGDVITLDIGGATTDVHSVTEDSDMVSRILTAPEPKAKRTVEGDLGVYINRMKVIESIGEEKFTKLCAERGIDPDKVLESYKYMPKTPEEFALVDILTTEAVLRGIERHAGQLRYVYGPSGRVTLAEGKDLTQVRHIVGTGGALTRLPGGLDIMKKILKDNDNGLKLYPGEGVNFMLDRDYIMASLGVLSKTHQGGAIKLLEQTLGVKFPSNRFSEERKTEEKRVMTELRSVAAERQKKEDQKAEEIRAMEAMGYDMSEYLKPEKIGGATQEEVLEARRRSQLEARKMRNAQSDMEDAAGKQKDTKSAVKQSDAKFESKLPDCNHECATCSRIHCPWRKVKA